MNSEVRLQNYLFDYPYKESRYLFVIPANSQEEAEERFGAIRYGRFVGSNATAIPAGPTGSLVPRLLCWYRNWRNQ